MTALSTTISPVIRRKPDELAAEMAAELADAFKFSAEEQKELARMDAIIVQAKKAMEEATPMTQAFITGKAINLLRMTITAAMMEKHILPLMNNPLGFLTDRNPSNGKECYSVDIVRDCMIEGAMRGARPVGNEINIIASRCYLTRAFFERAVREYPGVTNVVASPGTVQNAGGKIVVRFALSWRKNGAPDCLVDGDGKPGRPFEVKDFGMGFEAVIGKAHRKAFAAAYQQISGSNTTLPEGEIGDTTGNGPAMLSDRGTPGEDLDSKLKGDPGGESKPTPPANTAVGTPSIVDEKDRQTAELRATEEAEKKMVTEVDESEIENVISLQGDDFRACCRSALTKAGSSGAEAETALEKWFGVIKLASKGMTGWDRVPIMARRKLYSACLAGDLSADGKIASAVAKS